MSEPMQLIEARADNGAELTIRFPQRLARNILPYMAVVENLARNGGFQVHFTPPLRVENEATGEHFWLGSPPLGTRLAAYLHIPPRRMLPPILIAALGAAIEEGWI